MHRGEVTLLPAYPETLVLPYPADEILTRLRAATSNKPFIQSNENLLHFNGWVKENRFRLSRRMRRTNYYIPLITGHIEATTTGSLVLMEYRLFPTTRYLMLLWTVLLPLCTIVVSRSLLALAISLVVVGILHLIVWSNFRMQVSASQKTIHLVINQQDPLG